MTVRHAVSRRPPNQRSTNLLGFNLAVVSKPSESIISVLSGQPDGLTDIGGPGRTEFTHGFEDVALGPIEPDFSLTFGEPTGGRKKGKKKRQSEPIPDLGMSIDDDDIPPLF